MSLLMGSGTSQFPFSSFLSILLVFLSLVLIHAWIVSSVVKVAFLPTLSCIWLPGVKLSLWYSVIWQSRLYRVPGPATVGCSSLVLLLDGTMEWFWRISNCRLMRLTVSQFCTSFFVVYTDNTKNCRSSWTCPYHSKVRFLCRRLRCSAYGMSKPISNTISSPGWWWMINGLPISWMYSPLTLRLRTLLALVIVLMSRFTSCHPLLPLEEAMCIEIIHRLVVECCIKRYLCWGIVLV